MREYTTADQSLIPLIAYALKRLYDGKKYFQKCKVCGRLFLACTANIPTLCSDECRREQRKLNKRKYDGEKKDLDYEKSAKNTYMYWYKRVKPMEEIPTTNPPFGNKSRRRLRRLRRSARNPKGAKRRWRKARLTLTLTRTGCLCSVA
ncbi:hypothetical protein DSOL_5011 [Desulfosporosinus metallidurans]|uniref:Uncharacterized protein n=1 Tax=Desulfosporosinus metallidurans TaxID=1888891 RepID=A0A1Q8QGA9_9FIRM|nr:hypothetical protein DSOL_5011 [Desulfosporosinus metallidurans]